MAMGRFFRGGYDQVLALKEKVLRKMEQRFNLSWYMWSLLAASWALTMLGRWDEAVEEGQRGLRVGEEFSENSTITSAAWVLSLAYNFRGDLARALEWAELAVQKAQTPADKTWAHGTRGWGWCRSGEPRRGIEVLTQMVSAFRVGRFVPQSNTWGLFLGEGYWLAGEYDQARQTFEEILESAEHCRMKAYMGSAHRFLGEIALKTNPRQVEEPLAGPHFEKSTVILREIKAENELALAYTGYGRLHKQ